MLAFRHPLQLTKSPKDPKEMVYDYDHEKK